MDIIQKIPQGRLTQCKMKCIKDLVSSKIFKMPLCRGILLPVFCLQIKDKLESKEEVSEFFPFFMDNALHFVNMKCASSMIKKIFISCIVVFLCVLSFKKSFCFNWTFFFLRNFLFNFLLVDYFLLLL